MKKIILMFLIAIPYYCFSQSNTFPSQGFVGIGTTSPQFRLHILGDHNDTKFGLQYSHPDLTKQANLTLWASEPGISWTGTGIGNNVHLNPLGGITRLVNVKGGSYMRLLDGEMLLNIVNTSGSDLNAMHINSLGNIGIGTYNSNKRLGVSHTTGYGQIAKFTSKLEDEEVGIGTESNGFSWVGTTSNHNFQVYANNSPKMTIMASGNVGIGITMPQEKLAVNGKIRAQEIRVEANNWPDYVFHESYVLPSLESTERFIINNGHLPDIPSVSDVKTNGIEVGSINSMLLKKIEELTLHLISMKKEINELKKNKK